MPLALHRSLTFWSGILVIAFIVWAWRDSQYRFASARHGAWLLANGYSACEINFVPGATRTEARTHRALMAPWTEPFPLPLYIHGGGERINVSTFTEEFRKTNPPRRARIIATIRAEPVDRWLLFIPHWLLLLAVLIPWIALLLWQRRRRARVTTPT